MNRQLWSHTSSIFISCCYDRPSDIMFCADHTDWSEEKQNNINLTWSLWSRWLVVYSSVHPRDLKDEKEDEDEERTKTKTKSWIHFLNIFLCLAAKKRFNSDRPLKSLSSFSIVSSQTHNRPTSCTIMHPDTHTHTLAAINSRRRVCLQMHHISLSLSSCQLPTFLFLPRSHLTSPVSPLPSQPEY